MPLNLQYRFLVAAAKLLQLCLTLCNPIDGSLPGSHIPGILQARTLEWVAIAFSDRFVEDLWIWNISNLYNINGIMDFQVPTMQFQQVSSSATPISFILLPPFCLPLSNFDKWIKWTSIKKKTFIREFPGGPVVRTWHFNCCDPGSIPG